MELQRSHAPHYQKEVSFLSLSDENGHGVNDDGFRSPGDSHDMKIETFSVFSGCLFVILLPIVHISTLWFFWSAYHFPVDRASCTCECWDTIFKGPYESKLASYKHVYFNATKNTLQIWIIITMGVIVLYESAKYLTALMVRGKLRFSMWVLYLTSIFPHYYSWWTFINYLNDGFFTQWHHQMFFSTTEIASTLMVITMANAHKEPSQGKLMAIIGISTMHLIAGGIDQFVVNVFMMEGSAHQVIRDFGFIIPDVFHIILPIVEIYDLRLFDFEMRVWYRDKCFLAQFLLMCVCVGIGSVIAINL